MYGRTEDALATLARYRLNLAPLRFGAGQKGKILDGWLVGTPAVTTLSAPSPWLPRRPGAIH
ncbi:hypothetical protein [Microbulbifer taiwanensis]|uniref:hypothetical protein n=1 Tax=Microbulbifer taiwanensis TaxID=986746 RepID=UPI00360B0235